MTLLKFLNITILYMFDYSIYTYFLCSSTYCSMKSNRIPVTEVSCWIAMIFKSFSRSLSILIDKCVLSDILTYPPFFICIIIYVLQYFYI